jgi:signal transduction histidine kinase
MPEQPGSNPAHPLTVAVASCGIPASPPQSQPVEHARWSWLRCNARASLKVAWLFAGWLTTIVLPGLAHATDGLSRLQIRGLDGVVAHVASLQDPNEDIEWEAARRSPFFEPLSTSSAGIARSKGVWYRIDLDVPQDKVGTTAWFRATPALIWTLQLHDEHGLNARSGMSVPMSRQQHPASPSILQVELGRPQMRLFVRVLSAAPELTHMALLSDTALQSEVRRNTLVQALFLGAVGLMLVLTLLNWVYTRSALYRVFALYLGATALFVQFVNGGVNTYLLPDNPVWMARLSFASCMWAIAATIVFSLVALNVEQTLPRLAKPLKRLALLIFMTSLLGLHIGWIAPVTAVMWPFHLIFGLALLGVSIQQAIKWKTAQSLVVCAAYLCFNLFEKFPLMTMLGWFPVQAWTSDVAKMGLVSQMLLTQVQWSLRLREQQTLQRRAREADLEARAARDQRHDLLQFLGMFGHEVRTPLAIIHAATESLEMLPGADQEAHRSRHQRIRSAVERLNILSREALSRERIEASGWQPRFRDVDMAVLLEDVLWWLQIEPFAHPGSPRQEHFCLQCTVGGRAGGLLCVTFDDTLPHIQADPDMLHMALTNLLDNARKYGRAASEIRLGIHCSQPTGSEPQRCVIDVCSQGVELTAQERQRMFDKYWRGTERHNIPGAGMGLHLVKTVVLAHGGTIQVQSQPQGWTLFRMELPLQPPLATR